MVMPAGGYFGQALVVDVTSGTSRNQPLPDRVLRGYIGGSGLGTWLLYQLGTAAAKWREFPTCQVLTGHFALLAGIRLS